MHRTYRYLGLGLAAWALLGSLLACEGSSGGTSGRSQNCTTGRGTGTCNGEISRLTGTVSLEFEDDSMRSSDVIDLAGEFAVAQGRVEIAFSTPAGTRSTAEAAPDQPAGVSGSAGASFEGFYVTLTALDAEASGISYVLEYQTR